MKIRKDKQIAFLEKLIECTKSGSVAWDRIHRDTLVLLKAFGRSDYDPEGCFSCFFRESDFKGVTLLVMLSDETLLCGVGASHDALQILDSASEEIYVLQKRLFYIIRDKWLTANDFIDQFLSEYPASDSHADHN
jgi:hypothetical protein